MNGITKSGFKFEIAENVADDYEILEIVCEMQEEENALLLPKFAKRLLGAEQYELLKKHCTENEKVSATKMFEEVAEIEDAISGEKKIKNS